jgi:hypothetical protein
LDPCPQITEQEQLANPTAELRTKLVNYRYTAELPGGAELLIRPLAPEWLQCTADLLADCFVASLGLPAYRCGQRGRHNATSAVTTLLVPLVHAHGLGQRAMRRPFPSLACRWPPPRWH